jgi:hypothetical protein
MSAADHAAMDIHPGAIDMKNSFARVVVFVVASVWFASAYADCMYQGKSYPTGTKLGGLTCQADGTWK